MKEASEIVKWGRIKPYFDKMYRFNTIDIETVNNELFLLGYTKNNKYHYKLDNFYNNFHDFLINCVQESHDILTWSRYDNTHLVKLIFGKEKEDVIKDSMNRIGKISPIYTYQYKSFTFVLENIIKDSIIFKVVDKYDNDKRITLYNLKNLYTSDLETTAKNYHIEYYSKIGIEYHIIDPIRFSSDKEYKRLVLLSNEYDNRVLKDIANNFLKTFRNVTGVYPKSIFTAGSIARSYLLAKRDEIDISILNFKSMFNKNQHFDTLLDYSMRSYHGGKIESYILGYVDKAKIIDITSAYPYALANLPKLTNKVRYLGIVDRDVLNKYFYAFIRCDIFIDDPNFIHPLVVRSPINKSNLSPYGYIKDVVITKPEYDYLVKNHIKITLKNAVVIEHIEGDYPYRNLIDFLFKSRMENKKSNPSLADLFKTIINSLYGITFELTDVYSENGKDIEWKGYRAGDFFNPVIASYITSTIRTYLSKVSYNVVENGGEVFLNMTDSIIYKGHVNLDVFSKEKILGKFEDPQNIDDVIILGAGRYEYKDEISSKFTIKNRGFSVSVKNKSFYNQFDINNEFVVPNKTFVSTFRSTTNKYSFRELGHLIDDTYNINPFNLGGKRYVKENDLNKNINKTYVKTHPIYLDEFL